MDIPSLVLKNKIFLEIIYVLLISAICLLISSKADKYFRLSLHNGLRYFRNAFFFYGVAFLWKFFFAELSGLNNSSIFISQLVFEYFLIIGGGFLLYSLIWKKFSSPKGEFSSLVNSKLIFLYLLAIIIAVIDCFNGTYFLLFVSQISIFFLSSLLIFKNSKIKSKKPPFLKVYGFAVILGLIAWTLNFLTAFLFSWDLFLMINVGMLNIIFFLIILCGIIRITKFKQNGI